MTKVRDECNYCFLRLTVIVSELFRGDTNARSDWLHLLSFILALQFTYVHAELTRSLPSLSVPGEYIFDDVECGIHDDTVSY